MCSSVPIEFDGHGNEVKHANLLTGYGKDVTLELVQRDAFKRYSNPLAITDPIPAGPFALKAIDPANNNADKDTFYKRVDSQVVAESVKNFMHEEDYAKLLLKKKDFSFTDSNGAEKLDGPIMLWFVLNRINPSIIVGVEKYRKKLQNLRMHMVKNDVNEMCDKIEEYMNLLTKLEGTCESIDRYTYEALISGPNDQFNAFLQRINDDIESASGYYRDYDWTDIISACRTKANNMQSTGNMDKVDPRDAKILALTTKVEELNAKMSSSGNPTKPSPADASGAE